MTTEKKVTVKKPASKAGKIIKEGATVRKPSAPRKPKPIPTDKPYWMGQLRKTLDQAIDACSTHLQNEYSEQQKVRTVLANEFLDDLIEYLPGVVLP